MKFENTETWGFKHALRGMRNPMNSWNKSDSFCNLPNDSRCSDEYTFGGYVIGPNDLKLAKSLIKAGSEHRKFLRQIFVAVDITAPLYWWKELDTYKVGTVSNSTSTMHKLASTPITRDCFEMDDFENIESFKEESMWINVIGWCEQLRQKYNETNDKRYWKELIRLLPESWLQKRTITMNYENVLNMIHQRRNHKLTEWSESFINWAKSLPYADELLFIKKEVKE